MAHKRKQVTNVTYNSTYNYYEGWDGEKIVRTLRLENWEVKTSIHAQNDIKYNKRFNKTEGE